MEGSWILVIIAVLAGLTGAPFMNVLGHKIRGDAKTSDRLRQQELDDRLVFRQEQRAETTSLKLEYRTLKSAHDELEHKHDVLDRECKRLSDKVERKSGELERVGTENGALKSRVTELEQRLFKAYETIESERQARQRSEGGST